LLQQPQPQSLVCEESHRKRQKDNTRVEAHSESSAPPLRYRQESDGGNGRACDRDYRGNEGLRKGGGAGLRAHDRGACAFRAVGQECAGAAPGERASGAVSVHRQIETDRHRSVCLYLSVPVCLSMSVSVPVCLCTGTASLYLSLSFYLCLCICLSLYLSVSVSLYRTVSVSVSVPRTCLYTSVYTLTGQLLTVAPFLDTRGDHRTALNARPPHLLPHARRGHRLTGGPGWAGGELVREDSAGGEHCCYVLLLLLLLLLLGATTTAAAICCYYYCNY
jgi:hypothetical protein